MISDRRVALVTGASRGIGAEIARRLANNGCAVVVNYASSADHATRLVAEIEERGGEACAVRADIGRVDDVRRLFASTLDRFGRLDVLVHNAGIQVLGAHDEMDDTAFDNLVAVNLKAAFVVMREGANLLGDGGCIIGLSSGTTSVLPPRYGAYAATKAGVEALTVVLAKEMRGRNIRVNAVVPGPVATELFLTGKSEAALDEAAKRSPLERLGEPRDIAAVVAALAGQGGSWINGQTILVNGGFS